MNWSFHGQAVAFGVMLSALWAGFLFAFLARKTGPVSAFFLMTRPKSAPARFLVVCAVVAAVVHGGSKNGGDGLRNAHDSRIVRSAGGVAPSEPAMPALGLVSVRTNGVFLVPPSSSAVEESAWRRVGGTEMGTWIDGGTDSPMFMIGTNPIFRAYAVASGAISFESMRRPPVGRALPDGTGLPVLCPFRAPLGFVPESRLPDGLQPSRFWYDSLPDGGKVLAWENVLVDRLPGRIASFQAELHPSGDCVFRYDFASAFDPPPTNFVMGAQMGTNGVNALAVFGTDILSATVWRVDGSLVSNGVSVAELLCANGVLNSPTAFALEWKNVTGILNDATDSDGDGVPDWDEVFLHGTEPLYADTDGDGINDGDEIRTGANPLDADENGDGVPDGADASSYFSNPLFCGGGAGDVVISLASPIPSGTAATLIVGNVAIPLHETGGVSLSLPEGEELEFRLFSSGPERVRLSISPGRDWAGAGLWLEDPSGIFDVMPPPVRTGERRSGSGGRGSGTGGSGSHGGVGRMGWVSVSLVATNPSEWDHEDSGDYCVTSGSQLHLSLLRNGESVSSGTTNLSLDGLSGDGSDIILDVPGSGWATLQGGFLHWSDVTAAVSAHICDAAENDGTCSVCGHSPGTIGLPTTNIVLTLKHAADTKLDVPIHRRGPDETPIVSRKVQIRRQTETRWYRLKEGEFPCDWTAKVAGRFFLRAVAVDANGHEYFGDETPLEVMFPSVDQIMSDPVVEAICGTLWTNTINACTPEWKYEYGCWIGLNTATGQYEGTEPRQGVRTSATGTAGGSVNIFPKPDDLPINPAPNSRGAYYIVAAFHTHPPVTYMMPTNLSRKVTPSEQDYITTLNWAKVPGILYDYNPAPGFFDRIPAGWPKDAPAGMQSITPPERRETP